MRGSGFGPQKPGGPEIWSEHDMAPQGVGPGKYGPNAISSRPSKGPCKVRFCTVNCTVCRVKFETGSRIGSLLEIV